MNSDEHRLKDLTERALAAELKLRGITVSSQTIFHVIYKGASVGDYVPDLLVEDDLIVEVKCVERLRDEHLAQCLNYLRASGRSLCLLVNFQGSRAEWKRVRE